MVGRHLAHCYQLKSNDIHSSAVQVSKVVGKTKEAIAILTGKGEPETLFRSAFMIDDEVIALRLTRKVAIHDPRLEQTVIQDFGFEILVFWEDPFVQQ
jgi:hypothetical protein